MGLCSLIDKDVMVLQNLTNSTMDLRDPCGEPIPTTADASQAFNIKVKEVSDAEEEAGPVPISFPKLKTEPEVRCLSLYVHSKKVKLSLHQAMDICRTVGR
jgi:hypothetical protein